MLCPLLAYDANGDVIATLGSMVARDESGAAIGLVDFAVVEASGRPLTDLWYVDGAVGSGTWPEWLDARAHEFRVELDANKRIVALVHRGRPARREAPAVPASGFRRDRAQLEAAVAERIAAAGDEPADIRDLVGGPTRPLKLDNRGHTLGREPDRASALPLIGAER
jgi:hypothetical protein